MKIIPAVDGNWSVWSSWGTCSVSCGGGTETKTRTCDDPAPTYGGKPCVGDPSEDQNCNPSPCQSNYFILFEILYEYNYRLLYLPIKV